MTWHAAAPIGTGFGLALVAALAMAICPAPAQAVGLGVIVGDPTGLCGKLWLDDGNAVAAAAAWSFRDDGALHLHADYLHHHDVSAGARRHAGRPAQQLRPAIHYGLGFRFRDEKDARLSLRFPVGFTGHVIQAPADLFVELVPLLDLAPATELDLNAALGVRYYF